MSRIKSLVALMLDKQTAEELANQYYAEAKAIQKDIDSLINSAREECGKTGETIFKHFGIKEDM